ncbi:hypothetical protein OG223_51090 [Streptomyces sp. NBC_01478]|uniref:hypothetical protein n=1 Tax=Streptomyces sp. NBC_01478 TaxID=2903882 RepID=UPI002E327796|nr:hypothetical protein [Streptomyces sp. NBC_01478]
MPTTDAPEAFLAQLSPSAAWLRCVAAALHEQLPTGAREAWATRLYALLAEESDDMGTLHAVHVWHSDTILPLLAGDSTVVGTLSELHREAARGRMPDQDTWRSALTPVLLYVYDAAYDRRSAYAEAHTGARDHALANGFSATEADAYGHEYARLSSDSNARSCAEAQAEAVGRALARAYATDDGGEAYADTFPDAQTRAVVRVLTAQGDELPAPRLAEGFLSALVVSRS